MQLKFTLALAGIVLLTNVCSPLMVSVIKVIRVRHQLFISYDLRSWIALWTSNIFSYLVLGLHYTVLFICFNSMFRVTL
jgi:hypothetical protein